MAKRLWTNSKQTGSQPLIVVGSSERFCDQEMVRIFQRGQGMNFFKPVGLRVLGQVGNEYRFAIRQNVFLEKIHGKNLAPVITQRIKNHGSQLSDVTGKGVRLQKTDQFGWITWLFLVKFHRCLVEEKIKETESTKAQ